jgi:PAS domain S-box-containing protein
MPFFTSLDRAPLIEQALRLRRKPYAGIAIAIFACAIATGFRWTVGGELIQGVPFITYYPAIIIATLFGGFLAGLLSIGLSTVAAWYLFLPPAFSFHIDRAETASLLLFIAVAGVNAVIVTLLNIAVERVTAQEQNMRVLLESAPTGIVVIDDSGKITRINASAEKLFGYDRSELMGKNIEVLVPDAKRGGHRKLRQDYMRSPEARPMGMGRDLSGRRKDGSEFAVEIGLNPVSLNSAQGILATVVDISERKQALDRQQFLVRELQHRTGNLITVIKFIADRSLTGDKSLLKAQSELNDRLDALALSHQMLANAAWEGAPLVEMLEQESAAFSARVSIMGCDLFLNASAAQQFALITHELMTNAVKYGALSVPTGRVVINCAIEPGELERLFWFRWKETGGPRVSEPSRRGFGTVVLLVSSKLFGERVSLDYEPDGVRYELAARLSEVQATIRR